MTDLDATARREEERYVHQVYESIAEHFSRTRYKPWPGISNFFQTLPAGSLGVDAGCGNGKYLGLRSILLRSASNVPSSTTPSDLRAEGGSSDGSDMPARKEAKVSSTGISGEGGGKGKNQAKGKGRADDLDLGVNALSLQDDQAGLGGHQQQRPEETPILTIGLDRSTGLVKIAKERRHEVLVGDAIDMPWRDGAFDFAISIATIHHFTNASRRKEAIKTLLRAINKRHGKLFIQVWALEQDPPTVRRRGGDDEGKKEGASGGGQDGETGDGRTEDPKAVHRKQRAMDKLPRAMLSSIDRPSVASSPSAMPSSGGAVQACAEENGTTDPPANPPTRGHQDVFVPWKLQPKPQAKAAKRKGVSVSKSGGGKGDEGASGREAEERREWHEKEEESQEKVLDSTTTTAATGPVQPDHTAATAPEQTFQRYYHLFRAGELRELVVAAGSEMEMECGGGSRLVIDEEEEWEQGNWCIQARFV